MFEILFIAITIGEGLPEEVRQQTFLVLPEERKPCVY